MFVKTPFGYLSCRVSTNYIAVPACLLSSSCVASALLMLSAFFSLFLCLTLLQTGAHLYLPLEAYSFRWSNPECLRVLLKSLDRGSCFCFTWKGRSLLEDDSFSVWDITTGCVSRPRRLLNRVVSRCICTVTDEERLWTSMEVDPKPSSSSSLSPTKKFPSQFSKSFKNPAPNPMRLLFLMAPNHQAIRQGMARGLYNYLLQHWPYPALLTRFLCRR